MFSFNSPLGACETCRGFGRVIGVDFGLVVPDESKTLRDGAVQPWQTELRECQDDLVKYAKKRGVPSTCRGATGRGRGAGSSRRAEWVSWRKSWPGVWYGVRRFFEWLETKAYKMHIRVLLSKYRAYTAVRLKCLRHSAQRADALLTGSGFADGKLDRRPDAAADLARRDARSSRALPELPAPLDEATDLLLARSARGSATSCDVGLGYLTLDRQSRTLSGGEVQRINLTTALGTSLVNTLFVLDEPSIGLHPRDMGRVIDVMKRLRDAGNSLVVVEHDPQIMLAADRILDMGPGPGERGGEIVFFGTPESCAERASLTGEYLSGRKAAAEPRARRSSRRREFSKVSARPSTT